MYYIQRKDSDYLETVDEFETKEEAIKMLVEYKISDPFAEYYTSTRPCSNWKPKQIKE